MAEDSELITPLATAFKTTIEEDSSVVTGAESRLTVSDKSSKSAKLTIDDAFTYTSEALTSMVNACKAITLNLSNAVLKLTSFSTPTITNNLVTKSVTGDGNLSINGGSLTTTSTVESGSISLTGESSLETQALSINYTNDSAEAVGLRAEETSTDATSGGISIDVTGDTSITVTSKTGDAYGVRLLNSNAATEKSETPELSLTLTGDTTIKSTSESGNAYGIRMEEKALYSENTANVGSEGDTIHIEANASEDKLARAVSVEHSGNLNINGKTITVKSTERGIQGVRVKDLGSRGAATINVGSDKTESIDIDVGTIGVFAQNGTKINLKAKNITLTSASSLGTIQLQNGTENVLTEEEAKEATTLTVTADQFSVKNTIGSAVCVFSNAQLHVNANTEISAKNVIDVRGNSTANINVDGKHTTRLDGNIVFETPNTPQDAKNSGILINSNINAVLSGADSYWKGRSYLQYNGQKLVDLEGDASYYGTVTGFNLTIADGAKWTVTDDSFVNTLTLEGGEIDASAAKILNVGTWDAEKEEAVAGFTIEGTDNKLTLGSETTLNGAITMAEDSEIITSLATAYKGVTLSEDEEKLASIDEASFGARLTFSDDSDDSAILTIKDVFTYTTDVLSELVGAYKKVTVELSNATLKLTPKEEGEVAAILVDLTTGSITGEADVSLKEGKTLTLGADLGDEDTPSESNIGKITLTALTAGDGTTQGSTLKTTNKTKVEASEIASDSHGIIIVTDESKLVTTKLSGTKKIEVTKTSALNATTIESHGVIELDEGSELIATALMSQGTILLDAGSSMEVASLSQKDATAADVAVKLQEASHLTAGLVTDVKEITLGKDSSVTLGAEGEASESKIEKIVFSATDNSVAKVSVEKAAKALVTTIEGDGKGTLNVADKSTLDVDVIKKVAEVKVTDATLKADAIEGTATVEVADKSTLEVETLTEVAELLVSDATLKATTIDGSGEITLSKDSTLDVENLKGESKILVGDVNGEGAKLSVKNLAMTGGSIFVDPLYGHSTFHVESLGSGTLNTNITAGSGGLVVFGEATQEEVTSAVNKITALSEASAVVYVKKATKLGSMGNVVIDPNAKQAVETHQQKVLIRNGGTLVIDQAAVGNSAVFDEATALVIQNEANIGIVNAALGTINLGTTVTEEAGSTLTLYTDSPLLTASLASNGLITIAESADTDCISAVATMGIQSMIRHADAVLAETIADRIAEDKAGTGLWVAVRGERYEQDDVGSGFKADVGYGAFGADFAPTDATRLGLAIQYGHGKVKGNAYSVKNKFKDYSATLYGSALLGGTGIKLLGEVAYTQSKNDITNTYYTGLNQDLDAKMYSAGVTAQKSFEVGNACITPSVGVRVSRIETDAMNAGTVSIEKQKQTIVQVPIALRLSTKPVETASGWSVMPRFKVAYIPTFGDKKIDVFGAESTVLDTSPVQGVFGIGFKKGGFAADVAVQAGVGNRGTSSIGGKVGLSYAF